MAKFLLQFEGAVLKEIPAKDEITVGRKPDNDVVIDNPAVSSHHCRIKLVGDTFFVEDLNSTNGVFVNAKKIVKSGLQNNDVIGIAKHALKFLDDKQEESPTVAIPPKKAAQDATIMIAPERQQELAAASTTAAQKKPAMVRVTKGVVDQLDYELKTRSTYLGKSDRVQIKIKGKGLFGSAPESAAMIVNQDGYFLVPIVAGYVKLNGKALQEKQPLADGDIIEAGGTTLKFEVQN
ncbi:MAG TPA: FHA domain-containing protein [Terriglobia bacterium]|jgi:predicted component of type VI protein secretion system